MSAINRGKEIAVLKGEQSGASDLRKSGAATDVQGSASEAATAPLGRQPSDKTDSPATVDQAHIEQPDPYAFRDLAAQEDMAFWAMWMFVAAMATFVVTSLGTLLIWRQVKLTRVAVEDTGKATMAMERQNEIAEQSQRPWLSVKYRALGPVVREPSGQFFFSYKIIVTNTGQSPAIGIVDHAMISQIEPGPVGLQRFTDEAMALLSETSSALAPGEESQMDCAKFYVQTTHISPNGLLADGSLPSILVGVVYQNPRDGVPHCTVLNLHVGQLFSEDGPQIRDARSVTLKRKVMT
ncbi:hypothetical protein [Sphingopyxis sp.]|uniref:hypothetical protein n=1 Tax=Sphingopyxis sp. TaxID=1908224 RepID=UPI001D974F2F|nr:hypothetical protein [Sphingopyxis sp.]MBW8296170.1 hypothetical protein [Sphingopyxis sp.]